MQLQSTTRQLSLPERFTHGGRREGAGRPRRLARGNVPHRRRIEHKAAHPVHLTLRAAPGLPSFRSERLFAPIREALAAARTSSTRLRVVHFSVQSNHLHLLVEAPSRQALCNGAKGLGIRLSRAINRTLGRVGRVWGDRYHVSELPTPRQVRHALVYVLMNFKKHLPGRRGLDPRSSAPSFDGWTRPMIPTSDAVAPLCPARTWLLSTGWRRHGLIAPTETPSLPSTSAAPPERGRKGQHRSRERGG